MCLYVAYGVRPFASLRGRREFQRFKHHPLIAPQLEGGTCMQVHGAHTRFGEHRLCDALLS